MTNKKPNQKSILNPDLVPNLSKCAFVCKKEDICSEDILEYKVDNSKSNESDQSILASSQKDDEKLYRTPHGSYKIIADSTLPYPWRKRVEFIEPEEQKLKLIK
jgi:hypothetical protein